MESRYYTTVPSLLEKLATDKSRPSVVCVWAPVPSKGTPIARAVHRLKARRAEVRWTVPSYEDSVAPADGNHEDPLGPDQIGPAGVRELGGHPAMTVSGLSSHDREGRRRE